MNTPQGEVTLRFHYCPRGVIKPGRPAAEKPEAASQDDKTGLLSAMKKSETITIDPFYLLESEVSFEQFAHILGQEGFDRYAERVKKSHSGGEAGAYIDHLATDRPVLAVELDEVVAFCAKLDALGQPSQESGRPSLERRQFRIPTHAEWQYACRAVTSREQAAPWPHFNVWIDGVDAMDKATRADCLDQWKQMGRQEQDFTATQDQIIEIIEARWAPNNRKPMEILSACLRAATRINRNFATGVGKLRPLGQDRANAWNLHDLHEGVPEWVMTLTDRSEAQAAWKELSSRASTGVGDPARRFLFLAGGSYNMFLGDKNAWVSFATWGGVPLDGKTGEPQPFAVEQSARNAAEYDAGLRVLMERVLAPTWLWIVRRQVVLPVKIDPELVAMFDSYRRTIQEIAPASKQKELLAMLDYYRALAFYRMEKRRDALATLASPARDLFQPDNAKLDLSSLDFTGHGSSKPTASSPNRPVPSEDGDYLAMLQTLVERDP